MREMVKLLYGEEEQEDENEEEWLVRMHEDIRRGREMEREVERLRAKRDDSNASSSDFTHKLLIQRDKQIEALRA